MLEQCLLCTGNSQVIFVPALKVPGTGRYLLSLRLCDSWNIKHQKVPGIDKVLEMYAL